MQGQVDPQALGSGSPQHQRPTSPFPLSLWGSQSCLVVVEFGGLEGEEWSGELGSMDVVERASLCNCVVNFLLEEKYLLTAFELLHELLEDGRDAQAIRLKEFFSDPAHFPPDQISRFNSLRGWFSACHPISVIWSLGTCICFIVCLHDWWCVSFLPICDLRKRSNSKSCGSPRISEIKTKMQWLFNRFLYGSFLIIHLAGNLRIWSLCGWQIYNCRWCISLADNLKLGFGMGLGFTIYWWKKLVEFLLVTLEHSHV